MTIAVVIWTPDGRSHDVTARVGADLEVGSAINQGYADGAATLETGLDRDVLTPYGSWLAVYEDGSEAYYGRISRRQSDPSGRTLDLQGPAILAADNGSQRRLYSDSRLSAMPYVTKWLGQGDASKVFSGQVRTDNPQPTVAITLPCFYFEVPAGPSTPATSDQVDFVHEVATRTGQTLGRVTFDAWYNLTTAKVRIAVAANANDTFLATVWEGTTTGAQTATGQDFTLPAGTNRLRFAMYSVNGTAPTAGEWGAFANVVVYATNAAQTADVIFTDLVGLVPKLSLSPVVAVSSLNVSPFVFEDPTTVAAILDQLAEYHPDRYWAVFGPTGDNPLSGFEAVWGEKGNITDASLVDFILDGHDGTWTETDAIDDLYRQAAVGWRDGAGNAQTVTLTADNPDLAAAGIDRVANLGPYDVGESLARQIGSAFLAYHSTPIRTGIYETSLPVRRHPTQTLCPAMSLMGSVGRSVLVTNTGGEDFVGLIMAVRARPFSGQVQVHIGQIDDPANRIAVIAGLRRKETTQPKRFGTGQWRWDSAAYYAAWVELQEAEAALMADYSIGRYQRYERAKAALGATPQPYYVPGQPG